MMVGKRRALGQDIDSISPAKKLLLSVKPRDNDTHLADITEDFLHMDKLQFLPPCKVCNGAATGFHYGANTCEACKAFFRRYTGQEGNLKPCKKLNRCAETAKKGKISCAKCRYERCVKIGMTKEGIKKGRYTYEKRFRDAVELRNRQLLEQKEKLLNPELSENLITILTRSFSSSFPDIYYILSERTVVEKRISQLLSSGDLCSNLERSVVTRCGGNGWGDGGGREERLFYEFVERLADVSSDCEGGTYSTNSSSCCSTSSSSSSFSSSTDDSAYNRSRMIWLGLSSQFEKQLATVCTFAKLIPGFSMLPFGDQLILLKSACVEVHVLLRASSINHDADALVRCYPRTDELRLVPLSLLSQPALTTDFLQFHNKLTNRICRLKLDLTDLSVLIACIIMNPGRPDLQLPDQVEFIQKPLLQALEFSLNLSHPGDSHVVPDTLLLLPALRESSKRYFLSDNLC